MPTAADFRKELRKQIGRAEKQSRPHIEVNAGELHRIVGGFPGTQHSMPTCCDVMHQELKRGNATLIHEPAKGKGPALNNPLRSTEAALMPTGPKCEKRPRDPNQLAKLIVDIATGQVEDQLPTAKQGQAGGRDSRCSFPPILATATPSSSQAIAALRGRHGGEAPRGSISRSPPNLPHDWKEQRCLLGFAA
jgi:hypothetical protein